MVLSFTRKSSQLSLALFMNANNRALIDLDLRQITVLLFPQYRITQASHRYQDKGDDPSGF